MLDVERYLHGLARELNRRRRLRLTVRALWLSLTVVVVGLAVRLGGFALGWPLIVFPAAFVFVALAIHGWFSTPSLQRLARAYDHHFQLHEVLATGLEVARRGGSDTSPDGQVTQRLIKQTMEAAAALRRRVRDHPLTPWRDVEMVLAVAFLGLGLFIAGQWSRLPTAEPLALPALPTPVAASAEQVPEPEEEPPAATPPPSEPLSPEDEAAAGAMAEGLRDSGPTRPAADALDRGDPGKAASELRGLADQADQLSPEARQDLAEGLSDAAEQLRPTQPERADRLDQQADQLQGSAEDAAEAIDDLAGMADELGNQPPAAADASGEPADGSNDAAGQPGAATASADAGAPAGGQPGSGAGNGLGGETRSGVTSPPSAGGDIAPLPPGPQQEGPRTSVNGPQGPTVQLEAGGTRQGPSGMQSSGGGSDTPLAGEADPLRIPPEYRDVVENYFTPPE